LTLPTRGLTGQAIMQLAVKRDDQQRVVVTFEWMKDGPEDALLLSRLASVEIGEDERGKVITSCIVEPDDDKAAEKTKTTPSRRYRPGDKVALDLLDKALTDEDSVPPSSKHIPANRIAVSEDLWRRYCYSGQVASTIDRHRRGQEESVSPRRRPVVGDGSHRQVE
jgi:hypothetical protein